MDGKEYLNIKTTDEVRTKIRTKSSSKAKNKRVITKNSIYITLSHYYDIKVKLTPNTNSKTIGKYKSGSKILLEENKLIKGGLSGKDNKWHCVKVNGKKGYISTEYVLKSNIK